jgi:hypothetical protein
MIAVLRSFVEPPVGDRCPPLVRAVCGVAKPGSSVRSPSCRADDRCPPPVRVVVGLMITILRRFGQPLRGLLRPAVSSCSHLSDASWIRAVRNNSGWIGAQPEAWRYSARRGHQRSSVAHEPSTCETIRPPSSWPKPETRGVRARAGGTTQGNVLRGRNASRPSASWVETPRGSTASCRDAPRRLPDP